MPSSLATLSLYPLVLTIHNARLTTDSVQTLLAISHSLEDVVKRYRLKTTFYAGFQRLSAFLPQMNRFAQLASVCGEVLIFAVPDVPVPTLPGVRIVELAPTAPLASEWFLIIETPTFSAALLTRQLGEATTAQTFGRGRDYEGMVTFEPQAVSTARQQLETVIQRPYLAPAEFPMPRFVGPYLDYAQTLVGYLEQRNQQLIGLYRTLAQHNTELERLQKLVRAMVSQAAWETAVADTGPTTAANIATKTLTILFSDVQGFTRLSEYAPTDELFTDLNRYFDMLATTVYQAQGDVDKFLGDGMLAFFTDAHAALETASLLQKRIENFNIQQVAARRPVFHTRLGLATGPCLLGTVGSRDRQEVTLIGDTVNTASRLQALAPSGGILMDHATFQACGRPSHASLQMTNVRGKAGLQTLYVIAPEPGLRPSP